MELLRTERTTLRLWEEHEAPRALDLFGRREVVQWMDDDFANPTLVTTLDEARARIRRGRDRRGEGPVGYWAVEEHATGTVAGSVLLVPLTLVDGSPDPSGQLEIGWHLHPDAWGRGLAREAAAALLRAALDADRAPVHALMYPDNHPSAGVCEAIGMVEQPRSRDRWYPGESRHFVAPG